MFNNDNDDNDNDNNICNDKNKSIKEPLRITLLSSKIEYIKASKLKACPVQEPYRIKDVGYLKTSIKTHGFIVPCGVTADVDGTYTILYGHRRHAGGVAAGEEMVPCLIYETNDPEAAWALFTVDRGHSVKDWAYSWALSSDKDNYLQSIKKSARAAIQMLQKHLTDDAIMDLVFKGFSPRAVMDAPLFIRACEVMGVESPSLEECIYYLFESKAESGNRYRRLRTQRAKDFLLTNTESQASKVIKALQDTVATVRKIGGRKWLGRP